jgi:hypothetical protein
VGRIIYQEYEELRLPDGKRVQDPDSELYTFNVPFAKEERLTWT